MFPKLAKKYDSQLTLGCQPSPIGFPAPGLDLIGGRGAFFETKKGEAVPPQTLQDRVYAALVTLARR